MDINFCPLGNVGSHCCCDTLPGVEIDKNDRIYNVFLLHNIPGTSHCSGTAFSGMHPVRKIASAECARDCCIHCLGGG